MITLRLLTLWYVSRQSFPKGHTFFRVRTSLRLMMVAVDIAVQAHAHHEFAT